MFCMSVLILCFKISFFFSEIGEDVERDLINSLNDYELVNSQTDKTDEQWEEEMTELLNSA